MTSLSATLEDAGLAARERRPWSANLVEFLLVGGATPFLFGLSYALRGAFGLDEAELMVGFTMFWAAHVINDPHFAVTYLLFYRGIRARSMGPEFVGAQRVRYLVVGLLVPLVLAAWGLYALLAPSVWSLGLLIQLMFLLVGWHYVKQGFGVLTVLAARRSFFFGSAERTSLLAHAYAGWAYAWASPADPGRSLEEKGVPYVTFAHPVGLERVTQLIFLATFAVLCWTLVARWRRQRQLPPLTPLLAYLSSIWLWSVYSSLDPLVRYAIPALHSLQYLYMVWLLKRAEAQEREGPPWFEKPVSVRLGWLAVSAVALGWLLFRGGPQAMDGNLPSANTRAALGPTPYFATFYAFVNIHHYFMDTVIWRRENPATRYLRRVDEVSLAE
ncbi:MAG: hypothetical protein QM778_15525 [Myxococcales bacterium]